MRAYSHNRRRVRISEIIPEGMRIPRTLLVFVTLTALLILFLLFFYPFRNAALGFVSIAVTTMLLFFSYFVVTDLDNPFEGAWNVGPEPFAELITKFRASELESTWSAHGGQS